MATRFRSIFSYYGAKSKIVHLYSGPIYRRIIEPFAGGASYSLRHYDSDVWLNDLHGPAAAAWRFLTSGDDALRLVRQRIPREMEPGTLLSDLVRDEDPEDFKAFVQANLSQGTFGTRGEHTRVTPFAAQTWSSAFNSNGGLRDKCEYWIPRIQHWKVTNLPYDQLPNQRATWFMDSPYSNAAGRRYAESNIDYEKLAEWCRSRQGQVIVCENNDATWLPFRPLTSRRLGIYSDSATSTLGEAVYEQGGDDGGEVGLF